MCVSEKEGVPDFMVVPNHQMPNLNEGKTQQRTRQQSLMEIDAQQKSNDNKKKKGKEEKEGESSSVAFCIALQP